MDPISEGYVGESNPQLDDAKIDEGWDDEPEASAPSPSSAPLPATVAPILPVSAPLPATVAPTSPGSAPLPATVPPTPATVAPTMEAPVVNAWGPVPASRPPTSGDAPGTSVRPVAPRPAAPAISTARPLEPARPAQPKPVVARPLAPPTATTAVTTASPAARTVEPEPQRRSPAAPVANVRQESEVTPPSKKANFGRGSKDARTAKVAKKAAKKAARQAERKARAQSNNKAAIRATPVAAKRRKLDAAGASTTAGADGRTTGHSPVSDEGRRDGDSQRPKKPSRRSPAQPSGGMRALSTTMLILVAAVLVFAALGWFLAARH